MPISHLVMSKRMEKNLSMRHKLCQCSPKERAALLIAATPDLIHPVCKEENFF